MQFWISDQKIWCSDIKMFRRLLQKALNFKDRFCAEKMAFELAGSRARVQLNAKETAKLMNATFFSRIEGDDKNGSSEIPENDKKIEEAMGNGEKSQPQKEMPTILLPGAITFEELAIKSNVLVDKSLFIKEALESDFKAALITRPRRWGKTINMDMLKTFLQIEVDKDGNQLAEPKNKALFEGAEDYKIPGTSEKKKLPRLKIWDASDSIKNFQGKVPVIFITFKTTPKRAVTEERILEPILESIENAYNEHLYLKRALFLKIKMENDQDKKEDLEFDYLKFKRLAGRNESPSSKDIKGSIVFLSKLLFDHFGKYPFLLIDEYDAPLYGVNKESHEILLDIMRPMLIDGIKNNKYVDKTILTGILRIAKEEYLSVLNNLSEFTVFDEEFTDCFGFNEDEVNFLVEDALKSSPQANKTLLLDQIKQWYNGYHMGRRTLYNPWSIVNCIRKLNTIIASKGDVLGAIGHYWIDSGSNNLAENVFLNTEGKTEVQKFFDEDHVLLKLRKSVDYKGGVFLDTTLNSLLFHTGYLTISEKDSKYADSVGKNSSYKFVGGADNEEIVKCKLPNLEVKNYLINRLFSLWIQKKYLKIKEDAVKRLIEADIEDLASYKKVIETDLLPTALEDENEPGFCALVSSIYHFPGNDLMKHNPKIEDPTDERKRADTVFRPIKGKSETGVIHEYKLQGTTKLSVSDLIENALWQIYINRYLKTIFPIEYTKSVILRAVVFYSDDEGWKVEMKEHKLSIDSAKKLDKEIFCDFIKYLKEKYPTIENKHLMENTHKARDIFLEKKEVSSLDGLVEKYSKI